MQVVSNMTSAAIPSNSSPRFPEMTAVVVPVSSVRAISNGSYNFFKLSSAIFVAYTVIHNVKVDASIRDALPRH